MTDQPEALRLADALEANNGRRISAVTAQHSADLLRAQHAEIELLRAERKEDEGVIAVWRGRTQRAEAEIERLRTENTMIVLENERLMRQIYDSAIRERLRDPGKRREAMTRDEIIRMAQEAHQDLVTRDYPGHVGQLDPWTMRLLERFAVVVAAAEREACAQAAEQFGWSGECRHVAAAIRARGEP